MFGDIIRQSSSDFGDSLIICGTHLHNDIVNDLGKFLRKIIISREFSDPTQSTRVVQFVRLDNVALPQFDGAPNDERVTNTTQGASNIVSQHSIIVLL